MINVITKHPSHMSGYATNQELPCARASLPLGSLRLTWETLPTNPESIDCTGCQAEAK